MIFLSCNLFIFLSIFSAFKRDQSLKMHFLIYLFVIILSIYFWYQRKYGEINKILANISAPPSWPLLCHAPYFLFKKNSKMLDQIFEFNSSQPPVWRVSLTPFSSIITINDLKVIEDILSSTKFINKSVDYEVRK